MGKFETILKKMTLKDKILFLVSKDKNKTSVIENFNFPILRLLSERNERRENIVRTNFPSEQMLAMTYNPDLIKDTFYTFSDENCVYENLNTFKIITDARKSAIIEDPFLLFKYNKAKLEGIVDGNGAYAVDVLNIDNSLYDNEELALSLDGIQSLTNDKVFILSSLDDISRIDLEKRNKAILIGITNTKETACSFINNGINLVLFQGDYELIPTYLELLGKRYSNELAKLNNQMISEEEFDNMIKTGQILDITKVDESVSKVLDYLVENKESESLKKSVLSHDSSAMTKRGFDICLKGTKESIVLLKNNYCLPLSRTTGVAFFGNSFKDKAEFEGLREYCSPVSNSSFDLGPNFDEIKCVGYSHGTLEDESTNPALLSEATSLAFQADINIIYFTINHEITKGQLELLNAVKVANKKVVAVVITNEEIDLTPFDICDAILYTECYSEALSEALLAIISGESAPSGFLTKRIKLSHEILPIGYGLSYGEYTYSNIVVKDDGVTFTIKNVGDFDGYALSLLYIRGKKLRGYSKDYIKANEAIRCFIPFDEFTFRNYDQKHKNFYIEGGEYLLSIAKDEKNVVLQGKIKLSRYINDSLAYENSNGLEIINDPNEIVDFAQVNNTNSEANHKRNKTFGIIGLSYAILAFLILLVFSIISKGGIIYYVIFGILLAISTILLVLLICRKEKKKEEVDVNTVAESLTNMLSKLPHVNESNLERITKIEEAVVVDDAVLKSLVDETVKDEAVEEAPIVEEPIVEDEAAEEDINIEQTTLSNDDIQAHEEEELRLAEAMKLQSGFENVEDENEIEYKDEDNLSSYVNNFIEFFASRSMKVSLELARNIFAALSSSKLVFMDFEHPIIKDEFINTLGLYFGQSVAALKTDSTFITPFNLAWYKNNDSYQKTDFIVNLYKANKYKKSLNLAVIDNVSFENFGKYACDIVDFAANQAITHKIAISKNTFVKIPQNIVFVAILKNEQEIKNIDKDLAKSSIYLKVDAEITEASEKVEVEYLSYGHLNELVHLAKKNYYLKEQAWKKLDYFASEINKLEEYKISNKDALMIENYSTVCINLNADASDSFNSIVYSKIIPSICALDLIKSDSGVNQIDEILTKVVDDNSLSSISLFNSLYKKKVEADE